MTKIKVRSYQLRSSSGALECKLSSSTQCLVSQIVKFILEITFLSEISIEDFADLLEVAVINFKEAGKSA